MRMTLPKCTSIVYEKHVHTQKRENDLSLKKKGQWLKDGSGCRPNLAFHSNHVSNPQQEMTPWKRKTLARCTRPSVSVDTWAFFGTQPIRTMQVPSLNPQTCSPETNLHDTFPRTGDGLVDGAGPKAANLATRTNGASLSVESVGDFCRDKCMGSQRWVRDHKSGNFRQDKLLLRTLTTIERSWGPSGEDLQMSIFKHFHTRNIHLWILMNKCFLWKYEVTRSHSRNTKNMSKIGSANEWTQFVIWTGEVTFCGDVPIEISVRSQCNWRTFTPLSLVLIENFAISVIWGERSQKMSDEGLLHSSPYLVQISNAKTGALCQSTRWQGRD